MKPKTKVTQYLGDGIYVRYEPYDDGDICEIFTSSDGLMSITLNTRNMDNLCAFVKKVLTE